MSFFCHFLQIVYKFLYQKVHFLQKMIHWIFLFITIQYIMSSQNNVEEIVQNFNNVSLKDKGDTKMIDYILEQNIDEKIKELVIYLIESDRYESYLDIYNICIENNIELPPI